MYGRERQIRLARRSADGAVIARGSIIFKRCPHPTVNSVEKFKLSKMKSPQTIDLQGFLIELG